MSQLDHGVKTFDKLVHLRICETEDLGVIYSSRSRFHKSCDT